MMPATNGVAHAEGAALDDDGGHDAAALVYPGLDDLALGPAV